MAHSSSSQICLKVRGLSDNDVEQAGDVLRACFIPPVAELYCRVLADRHTVDLAFTVAEHEGMVVGLMMHRREAGGSLYLACLAVGPYFQGRGVGKRMVEWLKSRLPRLGCREITLHVHSLEEIPQRLYLRCGFEIIETIPNCYVDGAAAHHMRYRTC